MLPKFQPTRSGAQRRNGIPETTDHLRDENTDSEEEIQETETEEPSPYYQTRSVARQQVATSQSDEGNDSSTNGSSSGEAGSDSGEESGNEAIRSPVGDSEPLRGDVLKAKTSGFRDSLCWKVKGADKYFYEGLTTTARGHLKQSIAEEVRIIDSELVEEAHIPILARINVETPATKKYDLEKSMDETRYDLKHKNRSLRYSIPVGKVQE
ncbi:hypothetical protein HAX54_001823 [Datura stramonium]|uniref:Uncharacterized protein n=1 Tax=Datura stramonium TaxID=4076 RepID=A0ABS8T2Z2_DATST|nr:hypothetical protein [Datura stramonium]